MRIIVCVKQVPDVTEVRIDPKTNTLIREGVPSIMNPYDLHAVEAGLQIRDKVGGKVTVVTMGPPQAEEVLREAISMGVDDAVLLTDRRFAGADTWATAYTLSKAVVKLGFDLIICGKQAIDGDTAQVGPEMAEFLDIPHVSYVRHIESITPNELIVERLMDDCYEKIALSLPALITVVKELNTPRPPSIRGKMAAKKAQIPRFNADDIGAEEENVGLKGSPTMVKNIFAPPPRGERRILEGTPEEQVETLVRELRRLGCL
ncbi:MULTISPECIES: electron transfer flavoprotein subunit beta/FixA family protein [Thermodesulfovibrio]|uniref:electron transfer flavoprotein subunit beta/FixA family protein n=1 Tax=Thermodesulfovibrio TaxID=28261 RepID=UPI00262A5DFB|nr:electron transfer flavoprotein subunit beta/FixA family protein [Thermodesulfovibrio sp.]